MEIYKIKKPLFWSFFIVFHNFPLFFLNFNQNISVCVLFCILTSQTFHLAARSTGIYYRYHSYQALQLYLKSHCAIAILFFSACGGPEGARGRWNTAHIQGIITIPRCVIASNYGFKELEIELINN